MRPAARPVLSAALLLVSLLAASPPARAQTRAVALPTDATLARLIEESLAARPELQKQQDIVRAERERVPQAGALPEPMLQIGIQNDGFTSIEIGNMPTSYVSFMASQTFPWPGKRGLRSELAELGVTEAKDAILRARLSTEAEVRRAYLDLMLLRDGRALLDQLEAIWQRSSALARIRYEAGEGVQSDLLRAQLELTRILQRRLGLQADERIRGQAINRLRAHPLDEPIELHTHIRDLPALAAFEGRFSAERAVAESPELAAARLGITRADKSAALAEKGYYPDITVGAGVMYRGALPPMWTVTLGGPVPLFAGSRQSRAVAENRAWSSAAQKDVAAIEQGLRLRSAERHAAFSAVLQQIELYNGLLVQSEATIESTLTQYRIGKVTFASVLEANAGYVADQEGYLQAIAAAHRILIAEAELSLDSTTMPAGGSSGGGRIAPAAAGGSSSGM